MMNAGERGRPRKWSGPSSPTLPLPQPISPEFRASPENYQDAQPERVQSLPPPRRKRKRQVIEDSDDESDVYITQNVQIEQRKQRRINEDKANKRVRSAEVITPARRTRAAAKASSDIKETADFLLALGLSSPHSTTLAIEEDNRDEVGLMLLAEAVALAEDSHVETTQEQDAQIHSPLFFEEETDLVTLRGSEVVTERETSVDDTNTPRTARRDLHRKPQLNSGERFQVSEARVAPAVLSYSLPLDTEMTYVPRYTTVSQRLRDLYRSSLVVKGPSGSMRPLWRQEQDRQ
ncbi:hypothetical protein MMC27_000129 [Xylographa pallens]|nr:hypothetical protein [Xylographa pallens]